MEGEGSRMDNKQEWVLRQYFQPCVITGDLMLNEQQFVEKYTKIVLWFIEQRLLGEILTSS